jgi:aminoglycoside phosphotransferase (APT) family kinase protein
MTHPDQTRCQQVNGTLRCPAGTYPEFVIRLLRHLEERRFEASPRFLGQDGDGRQLLTFIDGYVAPDLDVRRWNVEEIEAAFLLLRRFHDLMADSQLASGEETVCHNDFTPCNVVFSSGSPIAMIDWEFAAPGTRMHDLGHAVWQWVNVGPAGPAISEQATLIRRVLGAYGVAGEADIVDAMRLRQMEWLSLAQEAAAAMGPTLGRSPDHWAETAAWVGGELAWLNDHGVLLHREVMASL